MCKGWQVSLRWQQTPWGLLLWQPDGEGREVCVAQAQPPDTVVIDEERVNVEQVMDAMETQAVPW